MWSDGLVGTDPHSSGTKPPQTGTDSVLTPAVRAGHVATRPLFDRGLRSQVKPAFMAPAVGTALAGGLLAPSFAPAPGLAHALAVGAALYVAHLVDEYVDAHVRGEDEPSVPARTALLAAAASGVACLALLGLLWARGRRAGALAGAPLLALAVLYAPVLDRHPVAGTASYPVGVGLALVGGYAVQVGVDGASAVPPPVAGVAGVLVVALSAVKVSVDRLDRDFDRRVGKRTVPVVLGGRGARRVSAALLVAAAGLVAGLVASGALPAVALLAVPILVVGAGAGLAPSAERAVRVQMALVYPVAAVLLLAGCSATGCVVGPLLL